MQYCLCQIYVSHILLRCRLSLESCIKFEPTDAPDWLVEAGLSLPAVSPGSPSLLPLPKVAIYLTSNKKLERRSSGYTSVRLGFLDISYLNAKHKSRGPRL
jgi:hypothetical protein